MSRVQCGPAGGTVAAGLFASGSPARSRAPLPLASLQRCPEKVLRLFIRRSASVARTQSPLRFWDAYIARGRHGSYSCASQTSSGSSAITAADLRCAARQARRTKPPRRRQRRLGARQSRPRRPACRLCGPGPGRAVSASTAAVIVRCLANAPGTWRASRCSLVAGWINLAQ